MDRPRAGEKRSNPGQTHSAAVLEAELRLLIDQQDRYGVLTRSELARPADARLWHEGSSESALRLGVHRGEIVVLPRTSSRGHASRGTEPSGRSATDPASTDGRRAGTTPTALPRGRSRTAAICGFSAAPDLQPPCSRTVKRGV